MARQDEQMRQARVREGTARVDDIFGRNFGDDFYSGRRNAYLNYATPQLEDQYGNAQQELTFALARGGNLDSSVRGAKFGELAQLYDQRRREVGDQALAQETEARNNIENARGDLIRTLSATGDAEGAANSAMARASALSSPAAYSPLGDLFVNFTSALGTQAALERANAMSGGIVKPRYNTGLFGTNPRAVTVT